MTREALEKSKVYKVGFLRQLLQWITFIVLLPFFISMPVMIGMRAFHGRIFDALWLTIVAVLFAIALIFLALQIQAARRTRIKINNDDVDIVVPKWRGPTPFAPFDQAKLPYSKIEAVEQRGEIYRSLGILGLQKVASVVTSEGDRYVLGYSTENESDAPISFGLVAETLAERAGVQLVDKGVVNVGTQIAAAMRGTPNWDTDPLEQEDVEATRKRAQLIFVGMITGFFILVIAGVVIAFLPDIKALISG